MAFTKPNRVARFAGTSTTETANSSEPSSGKKDLGWVLSEAPPSSFYNWLHYRYYQWNRWIDERLFDGVGGEEDFWIKAPSPALSSDDGGEILIVGGEAGADADKDGGDAILYGGGSTGSGSSKVEIGAAVTGGTGTTARQPETFITADGLLGELYAVRPVRVVLPGSSPSAYGARIDVSNIAANALSLIGDFSAPVKAPLSISAQSADPSSPVGGELYVNGTTDQIAHYSAANPRWQNLDSVALQTLADATQLSNFTSAFFDQKYTIPANTLRPGSIIKLYAWGEYSVTGTPNINFNPNLVSGFGLGQLTQVASAGSWTVQGQVLIRTIGAAGTKVGWQKVSLTNAAGTQRNQYVGAGSSHVIDTTVTQDVQQSASFSIANVLNTATMYGLIVEVL